MKSVLILDANQRSALSVTRSLGSKDVTIVTADETESSLAGASRFSAHNCTYPSPATQADAFIDAILGILKQHDTHILFPMTELTTTLLLEHKDKFEGALLPFPAAQNIESLSNKCNLMKLAESRGIPFPQTWFADSPDTLPVPLNQLPYPLVLKPGKSWLLHNGQWLHTEVKFANNADEAKAILNNDPAFHAHPFILQRCVPGKGEGVFILYENGSMKASFAHHRIREKPPRGGVSVLSESAAVDKQLLDYSRQLLDAADWHGIAMVEFRVDDEGNANLMEINTRFWGSLQLAIDAGIDFPWMLYQITCGEQVSNTVNYKTGKRLRWILGDLDSLYLVLRDSDFSARMKLSAIISFLTPHPFRTRHEVNRLNDLKPFLWELKHYIKCLF